MSPENKLRDSRFGFKSNHREARRDERGCPYCGDNHCWWYGYYVRKGFHRSVGGAAKLVLLVRRRLCRNPSCGRSFAVLPLDVIPYQRFFRSDFFGIASMAESGKSAYRIAGELDMDVGDSVVRRTLSRIGQLRGWLVGVSKELSLRVWERLETGAGIVLGALGWFKFTRRWFHALYPKRMYPEACQHNLALPSQSSA